MHLLDLAARQHGMVTIAQLAAAGLGRSVAHRAAHLWGFRPEPPLVHVNTPRDQRPRPGIRTHRTTRTPSLNAAVLHGLPLTDARTTLADLRRSLTTAEYDRAAEQAAILRLIPVTDEPAVTRSEAERRFLRLVNRAGLPRPRINTRLHGFEVDFHWAAEKLVAEIDGFAFHRTRQAFERDRRRDADLAAAGCTVVRFTWRRITEQPELVAARLAVLLRRG